MNQHRQSRCQSAAGEQPPSNPHPLEPLKSLILGLAHRPPGPDAQCPAAQWQGIWRQIVADPWFQAELAACASRAVRHAHAHPELAEDVAAECLLILADELRVSPDLCVDVERAERDFAAWMGTIIRHACSKALHRLRPLPSPAPLLGMDTTADLPADRDRQIDLVAAIDRLAEPERSIMHLRLAGRSLTEAAYLLGISRKQADRAYQRGLRQLERALRAYRPPPKT